MTKLRAARAQQARAVLAVLALLSAPTAMSPGGAVAGNISGQSDPPPPAAASPHIDLDDYFVPVPMSLRETAQCNLGCDDGMLAVVGWLVAVEDQERVIEFGHKYCDCSAKGTQALSESKRVTHRAHLDALQDLNRRCFRSAAAAAVKAFPFPAPARVQPPAPSRVYIEPPYQPPLLAVPAQPRPPASSMTDCEWVGDFLECDNGSRHTTCEEVEGFLHCDSSGD